MKECFIIMPITTPDVLMPKYGGDKDHFGHVLEHLFVPALEKAEIEPIPPKAQGSDLIQGEIIKNLEKAELVLCDMSGLNPNVFFELGIRTALNKPVCLVVDDLTERVPFDINMVNHHEYLSSLNAWELEDEEQKLTKHITSSMKRSDDKNALWQYFGLSAMAEPTEGKGDVQDSIAYLTRQVEAMRKQVSPEQDSTLTPEKKVSPDFWMITEYLSGFLNALGVKYNFHISGNTVYLTTADMLSTSAVDQLGRKLLEIGYGFVIDSRES